MVQLIIAAFPQSIIKFQLREDNISLEEALAWAPEFNKTLEEFINKDIDIDEIYILGPASYITKFVDEAKDMTTIPVFKEGI